ncbi:MAG: hypothetical protein IKS39_08995 [Clostridia bacterium]|nr:hypothetical protein [Clostridia bacterium]
MLNIKKVIAFILVLVMAFGYFAVSAYAVLPDGTNPNAEKAAECRQRAEEAFNQGNILSALLNYTLYIYYKYLIAFNFAPDVVF